MFWLIGDAAERRERRSVARVRRFLR